MKAVLLAVLFALACGAASRGEERALNKAATSELSNKDPLKRQVGHKRILNERKALIGELLEIIARKDVDTAFNGPLHYAIVTIGELRAKEAIAALRERLMYVPDNFMLDEQIPKEGYYVTAIALREIGTPAIEPMMGEIRTSADQARRELAAWVLMEIDGKDQAIHRLKSAAATFKDAPGDRLTAAAKYLESWKPRFENPTKAPAGG